MEENLPKRMATVAKAKYWIVVKATAHATRTYVHMYIVYSIIQAMYICTVSLVANCAMSS